MASRAGEERGLDPFFKDKMGNKCRLCGKRFMTTFCQRLHSHVHKANGLKCEKSMKRCSICNKSFEKEAVYKFHKLQFHQKRRGQDDEFATTTVFPSWFISNGPMADDGKIKGKTLNRRTGLSQEMMGKSLTYKF